MEPRDALFYSYFIGSYPHILGKSPLTPSAKTVGVNQAVTFTAKAASNTGTVKYAFTTSDGKTQAASTTSTFTWTPTKTGTYTIAVNGVDSKSDITAVTKVTVTSSSTLLNNSTLSATTVNLGDKVTAKCSASGGKSPYTYAVYVKKTTDTKWTTKQNFSTNASVVFTPLKATSYNVCIKVKDASGTIVKKYINLTVKDAALKNTSSLSATTVKKGSKVTAKCSATGGTAPYTYAVYVKKTTDTNWTLKQNFKTNASVVFTTAKVADYKVCIKVKDSSGTIVKKYIDLKST